MKFIVCIIEYVMYALCLYITRLYQSFGAYVLQEASFLLGLRYIVTSLSIYDEYSNDILDMREGSCFPRFSNA